jgi:hypothetical protein
LALILRGIKIERKLDVLIEIKFNNLSNLMINLKATKKVQVILK